MRSIIKMYLLNLIMRKRDNNKGIKMSLLVKIQKYDIAISV